MTTNASPQAAGTKEQYSLAKLLGIWVVVSAPMGILAFVLYPALADFESDPIGAAFTRVGLITVGLIWQFVLSMIIVYREEGDLSWATIRRRLWLNTPRDPQTGEPRRKLWLWLIPFILLLFASYATVSPLLDRLWVSVFPFFEMPASANLDAVLRAPEIVAQLVGNWLFFGLFLVMAVFNIFGEEFIFRGVLLPKMEGVFGRWDWLVNGVLMSAYHWHQPWMILGGMVGSVLCFALPAKRFRSTWMAIVIHAIEYVLFIPLILMIVLGLM
jgi:membrane protease YdiL (CAAX protease family)